MLATCRYNCTLSLGCLRFLGTLGYRYILISTQKGITLSQVCPVYKQLTKQCNSESRNRNLVDKKHVFGFSVSEKVQPVLGFLTVVLSLKNDELHRIRFLSYVFAEINRKKKNSCQFFSVMKSAKQVDSVQSECG